MVDSGLTRQEGGEILAEEFLLILEGGPFPGEHTTDRLDWPLPERVLAKDHAKGVYLKVFESKGPASKSGDVKKLREAKYSWDEDTSAYELSE